jgi:hypothetical protein
LKRSGRRLDARRIRAAYTRECIESQVAESVIVSGLTDKAAYRLESRIIGEFHKHRVGQLWNTIDERFLDPRFLPDEWDDPEQPAYKLPRPLVRYVRPIENRCATPCKLHSGRIGSDAPR